MEDCKLALVTGSKEALDENLTQEEQDALDAYYAAIDSQGDIESLDEDTQERLQSIWIVRKCGDDLGTVHKAFLNGGTVHKRHDYKPWE